MQSKSWGKTAIKSPYHSKAVCPFCKSFIDVNCQIHNHINAANNQDALLDVMRVNANKTKCSECDRNFYYESDCLIHSHIKNYAIVSIPSSKTPLPSKSAIFNILKKDNFRFRLVREFIFLSEKTRIFEAELDDRVIEVIKYTYVAVPNNLGTDAKIILNGVDNGYFVFTLYDENDLPIISHRVSIDSYSKIYKDFAPETVGKSTLAWEEINLKWAQNYKKEKRNE